MGFHARVGPDARARDRVAAVLVFLRYTRSDRARRLIDPRLLVDAHVAARSVAAVCDGISVLDDQQRSLRRSEDTEGNAAERSAINGPFRT